MKNGSFLACKLEYPEVHSLITLVLLLPLLASERCDPLKLLFCDLRIQPGKLFGKPRVKGLDHIGELAR